MKTTKLLPFIGNEDKCVSGVTRLYNDYCDDDRMYIDHTKSQVCFKTGEYFGTLSAGNAKILHETEPQYEPHDMQSFPRDGWFRTSSHNLISRITDVAYDGVYFGEEFQTFEDMLNIYKQVNPDNTTSPCGREVL